MLKHFREVIQNELRNASNTRKRYLFSKNSIFIEIGMLYCILIANNSYLKSNCVKVFFCLYVHLASCVSTLGYPLVTESEIENHLPNREYWFDRRLYCTLNVCTWQDAIRIIIPVWVVYLEEFLLWRVSWVEGIGDVRRCHVIGCVSLLDCQRL